MARAELNETLWAKTLGVKLHILNEEDATICGTIVKTDTAKLNEANASLRKIVEPRGVWNDEEEVGP